MSESPPPPRPEWDAGNPQQIDPGDDGSEQSDPRPPKLDPDTVWDAQMGGWVHPPGQAKPYIDSRTGRWVGGPSSGQMYRDQHRPMFFVQTKILAIGAVAVGILLFILTSHNSSNNPPATQSTPVPTLYQVAPTPDNGGPAPTYTPSTPYPVPSGLPGDFTG